MNDINRMLADFLSETALLIDQADKLPLETAEELYEMYEDAAKAASDNISDIDPELRVQICARLDSILERIADFPISLTIPHKNIYTVSITEKDGRWHNTHLMKDVGLSIYMLGKELGMHPVMLFGTDDEAYPYLDELPGMEMIFAGKADTAHSDFIKHLNEHYAEMDALIINGLYLQSVHYLSEYRRLRPDGKVYGALDLNSGWMDVIDFGCDAARQFSSMCDIIATSCSSLRDELNRNPKVSFPCRWLTNGFCNPAGIPVAADAQRKENIILTVGRIGTEQKRSEDLLEAFAAMSEHLPGWSLRLAGPIEPAFEQYIENYFAKYTDLKDKVVFTGAITDKAELYREYARAKIFALTSQFEGFPNIYAEALFHGCMFVTSDIDAADDMTNFGELGVKYERGDVPALSHALLNICRAAGKDAFLEHIPKALAYAEKYYDWNRNARKLAYMLFHSPEGAARAGEAEAVLANSRRIFLLQTPLHANLGDHAITVAELEFLTDKYKETPIVEMTSSEVAGMFGQLTATINADDIIIIHGGGNMGSLWYPEESVRLKLVENFPGNKIIIFPQSIYYEDTAEGNEKLELSRRIYSDHKDLHIFARDPVSYELMRRYYPDCNTYLAPDMVLYLDRRAPALHRHGALFCLRSDKEKAVSDGMVKHIYEAVKRKISDIRQTDTVLPIAGIKEDERDKYLEELLDMFKKTQLVVTDRLHGMVFAAITATPCLVVSNTYHKIKGVYEWLRALNYIQFAEENDDIEGIINELLGLKELSKSIDFKYKFDVIYDIIGDNGCA